MSVGVEEIVEELEAYANELIGGGQTEDANAVAIGQEILKIIEGDTA